MYTKMHYTEIVANSNWINSSLIFLIWPVTIVNTLLEEANVHTPCAMFLPIVPAFLNMDRAT